MNPSRMVLPPSKDYSRVDNPASWPVRCCLVHRKEPGPGLMRLFAYARVHLHNDDKARPLCQSSSVLGSN